MSTIVETRAFDRTVEQRRVALVQANLTRSARAQLKRDVKAGRVSVADVILRAPPLIEGMSVFDLLIAMPWAGRVRVGQRLRMLEISPSKTVGGLSRRQRAQLAAMVSEW